MKKFTFIGAGSLDFTKDLVRDILTFEAFRDAELMLMDIDPKRLEYAVKERSYSISSDSIMGYGMVVY